MSDDVLLTFLEKGLIDVGGDDDKLGHLSQTAGDLSGILKKTPAKASPFALVAFDPGAPATDPTIAEVENALRKRWQTYVNTFADTPVTVFRAMLLEALIRAAGDNDTVAVAFVASARNVLPFMEVGGEQEIWGEIVSEIERKVEARAEREWATPASIGVPETKLDTPSAVEIHISSKEVNENSLGQELQVAAGPASTVPNQGGKDTGGNPYWANQGNYIHDLKAHVRPVYDDSLFAAVCGVNLCLGEPMEVTGKTLTQSLMRDWTIHLTEPGNSYQKGELYAWILDHHIEAGGKPPRAKDPLNELQKVLAALQRDGIFDDAGYGEWERTSRDVPTVQFLTDEAFATAEVQIGEGSAEVYAWYLPASRKLAKYEGEPTFAMKVGRTIRDAQGRARDSCRMAPERPVIGFVLRTDDARHWEKHLQTHLHLKQRHLPNAIGSEWFSTYPDELRQIWEALSRILKDEPA